MTCNIVEYGGIINNKFCRNIFSHNNDINTIKRFNSDTYKSIYKYDNNDLNTCNFIAPLYLDLDIDDFKTNYNSIIRDLKILINKLTNDFFLGIDDIEIYFSGSKGFHIIIDETIFGFKANRTLNRDLKRIALYLKAYTLTKCIDTKIYDYKRLFRVPNTINSKTNLYKVYIKYNDLIKMTYDELIQYSSNKKEIPKREYKYNIKADKAYNELLNTLIEKEKHKVNVKVAREFISTKKLFPCVKYILANGSANGQRNNTTIALASCLFQSGYNKTDVNEIIELWNSEKNEEPLPNKEITATINSAYNNSQRDMFYGCSSFRELGVCIKGCPIYKE